MKQCLHCNKEFAPKKPKAIYCSGKCRTYANRERKTLLAENVEYFTDKNGIKRKVDKDLILRLAGQFDTQLPKTHIVAKKPQENDFIRERNDFVKHDEVLIHRKIEIVDYQKLFNECEFPDEYKALWEKINADPNVSVKEKNIWKIRLNAK